jgi:hypothetical protein
MMNVNKLNEEIEKIAWEYFQKNDLLKERDVQIVDHGTFAEQYMDDDLFEVFRDAYLLGLEAGRAKND